MSDDKKRILDMLAEGKLTSDEAMMLLEQVGEKASAPVPVYSPDSVAASKERMLGVRVTVAELGKEKPVIVNINLPLKAARIARRFIKTAIPHSAQEAMREQGVDLSELDIEGLIDASEDTGGDIVTGTHGGERENGMVRVDV